MKVYLLWCFDHGTPDLIGVYEHRIDAELAYDDYEREREEEGTYWLHYSITEETVIP